METITTDLKQPLETIMLGMPELREEAVQLYADLQICESFGKLTALRMEVDTLVERAAHVATVASESEAAQ